MRSGDHLYYPDADKPDFKALRAAAIDSLYAGAPEAFAELLDVVKFYAEFEGYAESNGDVMEGSRRAQYLAKARAAVAAVKGEG